MFRDITMSSWWPPLLQNGKRANLPVALLFWAILKALDETNMPPCKDLTHRTLEGAPVSSAA